MSKPEDMTNSEIKKPCLNCSEPTDNVYLNGVSLCGKCVIALINSRTPEPTKAENGLVPLSKDVVVEILSETMKRDIVGLEDFCFVCGTPVNGEPQIKLINYLADEICRRLGTPSITKEKVIDGNTSDGYHTFNELYDHRCLLWINLCSIMKEKCYLVPEHFEGWFLLGMETSEGQISYHCPNKYLYLVKDIPLRHPEYDGHVSKDVITRLSEKPFATITKEQLLAILPEEKTSIGPMGDDERDMLVHNACRETMKQRIEELFDK